MRRKVVFTGGGSAGHVSVNVALIPEFIKNDWQVYYIGSEKGIEKDIVESNFPNVPYLSVSVGKLRRYFSWENFRDPFLILKGVLEARKILKKIQPEFVFSKGGFVSVPVAIAAKSLKIPVMIHESDYTPGLANKMVFPISKGIFTTFKETEKFLKGDKSIHIGAVVRNGVFEGNGMIGISKCGFNNEKPVLVIMGGSLGAKKINGMIENHLQELLKRYQIIHFCGKGNVKKDLIQHGYCPFEFVNEGLFDLLEAADIVVSRAGSNSIFEFLALKKPMLLIPLSIKASRGDQILNAASFKNLGFARVIEEEELKLEIFLKELNSLYRDREAIKGKMSENRPFKKPEEMYELITKLALLNRV